MVIFQIYVRGIPFGPPECDPRTMSSIAFIEPFDKALGVTRRYCPRYSRAQEIGRPSARVSSRSGG
jgi:hypothetical protein